MTQAQNSERSVWKFDNWDLEFVSPACAKPRLAGRRQGFRYSDFGFFNYIGSHIVNTVLIQLR
jgi:hypothetical protein